MRTGQFQFISTVLLILVLMLAACGGGETPEPPPPEEDPPTEVAEEATPEEEEEEEATPEEEEEEEATPEEEEEEATPEEEEEATPEEEEEEDTGSTDGSVTLADIPVYPEAEEVDEDNAFAEGVLEGITESQEEFDDVAVAIYSLPAGTAYEDVLSFYTEELDAMGYSGPLSEEEQDLGDGISQDVALWFVGNKIFAFSIASGEMIADMLDGGSFLVLTVLGSSDMPDLGDTDPTDEEFILTLDSTDQGALEIGGEGQAELTGLFEAHDWTFEGTAGQAVSIRAEAAAGEQTDPRLHLVGPGGDVLTSDDDSGGGLDSLIANYELPEDGTYTIKVDVFSEGGYVVSISEGSPDDEEEAATGSAVMDYPSTSQGTLELGGEGEAELDDLFAAHDWIFEGTAGQAVTIRAEAAEGEDTDPRITLIGPNGDELTSDDDGGDGFNSLIANYELPQDGTYTVKVDVFSGGGYVISLAEGSPDDETSGGAGGSDGGIDGPDNSALNLPSSDQGELTLGEPGIATLDTMFDAHDWTFEGEAGQVVTISCDATPGEGTDPRINLLGPDGEWLTANDDSELGTASLIESFELPESGIYVIKVDVFSTGEYSLLVEQA